MTHPSAQRVCDLEVGSGLRLRYVERGNAAGEPVVFLHGWPDSSFSFSRVLPALPESLRAIALDQRGFGDSDRPESGYGIPELAADVAAFLDALDIRQAALVGHSFGSFVARQVAIAQPHRVSCLVLIGTGFAHGSPVLGEVQQALADLPDPIPREFAYEFQAGTVHHPVPEDFFEQIVTESLKLPLRVWRLAIDGLQAYDDAEQLPQITAPTLVLWGDQDALFPRSEQDRVIAALPNARLRVYPDTGHCPNWERPVQVAADIAQFLRSRTERSQFCWSECID
jgi:non-heme chloroperoxidase